jgi:hypothetical protein
MFDTAIAVGFYSNELNDENEVLQAYACSSRLHYATTFVMALLLNLNSTVKKQLIYENRQHRIYV